MRKMAYHNKEARVGVDHFGLVSGLQIPEDRRVVEEGQVDHVFALLKLGRVDPANLGLLVPEKLLVFHCTNSLLAGQFFNILNKYLNLKSML